MVRTNLKVLRVKNNLSQMDIAERIHCTRATYAAIENGLRSGSIRFWESLQTAFDIPDDQMWELMKVEQD